MVLRQQPHAEGGGDLSVNLITDGETDRMMSLRASSQVPLPREISLCEPGDAREHFRRLGFYEAMGLSGHPLVVLLGKRRLDAAMACAVSRASHLDRVTHYGAWLGSSTVDIVDPSVFAPVADHGTGPCTGSGTHPVIDQDTSGGTSDG